MVSQSIGNPLPRESMLRKIFYIGEGYETIVSRKRLGRSIKLSSKEVMMEVHHIQERRRT
jgi:hypothetical protein